MRTPTLPTVSENKRSTDPLSHITALEGQSDITVSLNMQAVDLNISGNTSGLHQGRPTFFDKGPQTLLWVGSGVTHEKIAKICNYTQS